jgi:N-methylhydantoinase A
MRINPQLSEQVIKEKIAIPLGLEVIEAAYTVWSTINHNMVAAIEDVTIWQGVDPREYLLVAGGGAAGLHIIPIARELKIGRVIVPKLSGVLSAFGGLMADMTMDFHVSHFTDSKLFDYEGVNKELNTLEQLAREFLSRIGSAAKGTDIEFFTEARYAYQVWELNIPLKSSQIRDKETLEQLVEDFHNVHEKVFGVKEPGQMLEFVSWGARAIARVPRVKVKEQPYEGGKLKDAFVGNRETYFRELGGLVRTPVYRGDKLLGGIRINSPAIIEEPTSTLVVFPGSTVTVSKWGNYLIEMQEAQ